MAGQEEWNERIKQTIRNKSGHPAAFLPNMGLRKSYSEQCAADNVIHEWTREKQAEYADMVIVAIADDAQLCREVGIFAELSKAEMQTMESCAVGGLAYLALHATDASVRDVCERELVAITAAKREAPTKAQDCTVM